MYDSNNNKRRKIINSSPGSSEKEKGTEEEESSSNQSRNNALSPFDPNFFNDFTVCDGMLVGEGNSRYFSIFHFIVTSPFLKFFIFQALII